MGVSVEPGRGRRSVAADLNLVPYIDLLTCMIAFLLLTSAWTQMARLEARQRTPGAGSDDLSPVPTKIVLVVSETGFNLVVGDQPQALPKARGAYDFPALAAALAQAKHDHPEASDAQIASAEDVRFEILVGAMDAVLAAGIPEVALVAAEADRL